ncbi:6-phosphogluconolactonase [termite gut metagenome]|uniref:6-phosphogluconolactonase n=1 Tax=termite gut metagenome TaxID=433724 RepID=A0A5J4R6M1_9ZZZZ
MIKQLSVFFLTGLLITSCSPKKTSSQQTNDELTMLIGTYTSGTGKGICTFRFNTETAESTPLAETEVSNASYFALSADGKFVYAVNEHNDDKAAVSAYTFDKEKGTLQLLNSQPTKGGAPCYIITTGKNVITANYSGGSISVFPLQEDGSLLPVSLVPFTGSGLDENRQASPHLHCVHLTPDGKYLFAADLGTDKIHKFVINSQADASTPFLTAGEPDAFPLPAGSGPRHITFAPNGEYAYIINELSGQVIAFTYADGTLNEIQSIAADTLNAQGSADIHISGDGKFLYASNRLKADGIAIFKIDEATGTLAKVGYQLTGIHPRNFIITPNDKFLLVACKDSNVIQIYERNKETGLLTDTKKDIRLDAPVCVKFAD